MLRQHHHPNDEVRAKFPEADGPPGLHAHRALRPRGPRGRLRHGAEWLEELIQVIKGNYEYVRDFFAQHFPGVVVTELEGTYLVWCDFRCFGMSDADMKVFLTDECMLYLDNGTDFGAAGSGYQRINARLPPQDPGRRSGPLLSGRQEARHGPVISPETRPEWIRRL